MLKREYRFIHPNGHTHETKPIEVEKADDLPDALKKACVELAGKWGLPNAEDVEVHPHDPIQIVSQHP